jgi:hypothetical protein
MTGEEKRQLVYEKGMGPVLAQLGIAPDSEEAWELWLDVVMNYPGRDDVPEPEKSEMITMLRRKFERFAKRGRGSSKGA